MKKIKIYLPLFLFLFLSLGCKKNKDIKSPASNFLLMTNSNDPLIVSYKKDNKEIDFFGKRNGSGIPTVIDNIIVRNGIDTTYYFLGEKGRPEKILTQNGTSFEFKWMTEKKAVLTIISKDGINQINTEIDFGNQKARTDNSKNLKKSERLGIPSSFKYFTPQYNSSKIKAETGKCIVNVSSCEAPTYADVYVLVNDKSGKNLGNFPTTMIEKGKYYANIPTNLAPSFNPADICNSVVSVLDYACYINENPNLPLYLCSAITAAVAATEIGILFAAEVNVACSSAVAGLELYCMSLGASPAPGAPSLSDQICNSEFINRTFKEDVVIFAKGIGMPYNSLSYSATVPGTGPFPDLNLSFSSQTAIRTLTLSPSSPVADQNYTAEANVFCLKTGSKVTLSISGSDGYTDRKEFYISQTQSEGIFQLRVPGADTGVNDEVTLIIELPDGSIIKRTASLVFN